MDKFLSCDWGTTSFRLRLIDVNTLQVMAEHKNDYGIAETYRNWERQDADATKRKSFYTAILKEQIAALSQQVGINLDNTPVILSGMASSTIGLIDLPYKLLPFNLDGSDLEIRFFDGDANFNPLIIVSGAQTDNDVMRGEETKIIGCASLLPNQDQEQLLVLPGTHPKHIIIANGKAIAFKTYMTGELFDLLVNKSVLAASVDSGGSFNADNKRAFAEGLKASQLAELLNAVFMVRTNQILKHLPRQQNYYYLSGLLIGAELKELNSTTPLVLVGGESHLALYAFACQKFNIQISQQINADDALIKGQQIIFTGLYCK